MEKIGKRFATCTKCKERFEAPSQEVMVTCPHCSERFNSIKLNSDRYVQPGAYLYAFIVEGKNDDLLSHLYPKELTPDEMKRVALDSLEEDESSRKEEPCKGIFLRCRISEYVSTKRNSIHQNVSYRVLKNISCKDPECGQCAQFYDDLSTMNSENIIWPEQPNDWTVYEARFKLGTKAYDELYEDWEWNLVVASSEKQI